MLAIIKRRLQRRSPGFYKWLQAHRRTITEGSTAPIRRCGFRMGFHLKYRHRPYLPRIGMHTVFIACENILFMEEWILYHRSLGVEHFFLYDNSKVEVTKGSFSTAGAQVGQMAKRGVPYSYIVTMTDAEIQDELDRLCRDIPNVHVIPWSPVDHDGKIWFNQDGCQTAASKAHRNTVDWMLFMDMDEYLVIGADSLPELCTGMMRAGYIGAEFWEHQMNNRYKHLDKMVCEIDLECAEHHRLPEKWIDRGKTICYIPRVNSMGVHSFRPFFPKTGFTHDQVHYRHYKCHHTNESTSTVLPIAFRTERGPTWKLDRVRPDWKAILVATKGDMGHEAVELIMKNYRGQ